MHGQPLSVSSPGKEQMKRKQALMAFYKGTNPIHRGSTYLPSWPSYYSLLNIITLGLGFHHINLRGDTNFNSAIYSTLELRQSQQNEEKANEKNKSW